MSSGPYNCLYSVISTVLNRGVKNGVVERERNHSLRSSEICWSSKVYYFGGPMN